MTVTQLREFLEEQEELGRGGNLICVVSNDCKPVSDFDEKFTTEDIHSYYDPSDKTITITT